ncbi:uncharacterized protein A4U43_C07F36280 [Asparagus officinalis]|uniref:Serine aminopeptidase S33 domain-containing protein n=1 Tax=Asparagus officinalis TaxID=4686 RepID=A0A5P1EJK3_ASPOF|nr:uncharacterized protein A4U43_C07F36280 [Asparagus officinalis]
MDPFSKFVRRKEETPVKIKVALSLSPPVELHSTSKSPHSPFFFLNLAPKSKLKPRRSLQSPMRSYLKVLAYGIGGVAVVGLAALVALQEKMVYVPALPGLPRSYSFTPARLRLDYEDVWLTSQDGVRLHSWFVKHSPPVKGPTILFFQENAGNIAHRLEFIRVMLQRLECNVFMLSYRGYGESDGYPSQHGIIKDAQVWPHVLWSFSLNLIPRCCSFREFWWFCFPLLARQHWIILLKEMILTHLE